MIVLDYHLTVPTEVTPFSLFPFACVHADSEGHVASQWQAFLREVQQTKHCVAMGLGDYYDWLRTHAREFLTEYKADGMGKDRQHSFTELHRWRRKRAKDFTKELWPIRDKLAFLSLGNHHHIFPDGTNDVQEMCRELECQYGGHGGFLRLYVSSPKRSAHIVLNILYHHGERIGGGSTMGGDINAMIKKSEGWEFDILMLAHNHKKHGSHSPIIGVPKRGRGKLVEIPKAYVRAGCFVRGYVEGCVTYAEATGLMNPTAIGNVRVDVIPNKKDHHTLEYTFKTYY